MSAKGWGLLVDWEGCFRPQAAVRKCLLILYFDLVNSMKNNVPLAPSVLVDQTAFSSDNEWDDRVTASNVRGTLSLTMFAYTAR